MQLATGLIIVADVYLISEVVAAGRKETDLRSPHNISGARDSTGIRVSVSTPIFVRACLTGSHSVRADYLDVQSTVNNVYTVSNVYPLYFGLFNYCSVKPGLYVCMRSILMFGDCRTSVVFRFYKNVPEFLFYESLLETIVSSSFSRTTPLRKYQTLGLT